MLQTNVHVRRMLPGLAALCLAIPTAALGQAQFRAVWADAFHPGFKTPAQVDALVNACVAANLNAIIAEVLAYHDNVGSGHGAYWHSSIVPHASDASGDMLAYLCQKAHAHNIEVHAWLVTYRVSTSWPPSGNPTLAAHPEWLMVPQENMGTVATVAGKYVLDPGSPDVQEYLVSIVRELVTNYEIDGINWDYVRYETTNAGYPADVNYVNSGLARYKRIYNTNVTPNYTGNANWNNFRRRTIDELVRRCRAEIPAIRSNPRQPLRHTADLICFGNAPSCGSFTSTDAYLLHQNWEMWMARGWLDAAIPMNYKREYCATHATWYRNWVNRASCWSHGRHWFAGVATYLNDFAGSKAQIDYSLARTQGVSLYSYAGTRATETVCDSNDSWVTDPSWYTSYLPANVFPEPAPTPTMPWRDPATATEGTIWGRVTDAATGQPVDDASVMVSGQGAVQTDGNGYYTVTLIPASAVGTDYAVTVGKSGFSNIHYPAARILAGDVVRYDFAFGGNPAVLNVSPANQITLFIELGVEPAPMELNITNLGAAPVRPLNWSASSSANWLRLTPPNGATLTSDTLQLRFETSGLDVGTHAATITISDAAAVGSPALIEVQLTVTPPPKPGDFDGDGDVDMTDFGYLQACRTPMNIPASPACERGDLSGDGDVDSQDILLWLDCMSGPDLPSDPDCLP